MTQPRNPFCELEWIKRKNERLNCPSSALSVLVRWLICWFFDAKS